MPLLVLTADRPPELREVGAGQVIDQIKLYGRFAKWFFEVGTHEATPERLRWMRTLACRACWTALDGRPGPVHLNFPLREPLVPDGPLPEDATGRPGGAPWVARGATAAVAARRVRRPWRRQGDGPARRAGVHERHRGRELPPSRRRGARGARPAARAHRRPAARAARGRRRTGHRSDQALRALREVVLRGRNARGDARTPALDAHARLPRVLDGARRTARPGAPELPAARAARPRRAAAGGRRRTDGRRAVDRTRRDDRDGDGTAAAAVGARRRGQRPPRAPRRAARSEVGAVRRRGGLAGPRRPARRRARAARRRSRTTTRSCATRASPPRQRPDLVLRVGDLPTSKPLRAWLAGLDARQVASTPRAPGRTPTACSPRSSAPTRARLLHDLPRRARPAELARRLARRRRPRGRAPSRTPRRRPDRAARRRARSASALPADATLVVASSMPVRDVETFFPAREDPPRVLANRGANGIDGTIATALGAAATADRPGRPPARRRRPRPRPRQPARDEAPRPAAHDRAARQRRRRDLRLPPGRHPARRLRGARRDPHRPGRRAGRRALRLRVRAGRPISPRFDAALDAALGAAGTTTIIHVRTDRAANVALHREVWSSVFAALA